MYNTPEPISRTLCNIHAYLQLRMRILPDYVQLYITEFMTSLYKRNNEYIRNHLFTEKTLSLITEPRSTTRDRISYLDRERLIEGALAEISYL